MSSAYSTDPFFDPRKCIPPVGNRSYPYFGAVRMFHFCSLKTKCRFILSCSPHLTGLGTTPVTLCQSEKTHLVPTNRPMARHAQTKNTHFFAYSRDFLCTDGTNTAPSGNTQNARYRSFLYVDIAAASARLSASPPRRKMLPAIY